MAGDTGMNAFGGRSIARDSVESFLFKVCQYGIGFVGSVLVSRALGPEGRGIYALPVVAAATVTSIAKLGIEQANVYMYGTAKVAPGRLAGQNGLVSAVMGAVGLALLLAGPALLPSLFSDTPSVLILLAGLTIPLSLHSQFTAGLMTLMGQVTWQFMAALIAGVVQVVVIGGLFALGKVTPQAVLATSLLSIGLTWLLVVVRFRVPGSSRVRFDGHLMSMTLRQSLPLHLAMVIFFLHLRVDAFLVKAMRGSTALGIYSVSVMLAETMYLAMDSIAVSLVPRQVANSPAGGAQDALRASRIIVMVGGSVALLWVALGWPILRIFFGSEFLSAYPPLVVLLPGLLALGLQRVCGAAILREGKPGRMALIYAVGLMVNVGLNLILIPMLGIVGAALSSSVSYSLGALLFLKWTASIAGKPMVEGVVPTRDDIRSLRRSLLELAVSIGPALRGRE